MWRRLQECSEGSYRGTTPRMSYRRRQDTDASLAGRLLKTQRLAAVSSIRLVSPFHGMRKVTTSSPLVDSIRRTLPRCVSSDHTSLVKLLYACLSFKGCLSTSGRTSQQRSESRNVADRISSRSCGSRNHHTPGGYVSVIWMRHTHPKGRARISSVEAEAVWRVWVSTQSLDRRI